MVLPPPLIVPPFQISFPFTVRLPAPVSVEARTSVPLLPMRLVLVSVKMTELFDKACAPLVPPSVRLPHVALTLRVTAYVPLLVIKTVSAMVGTWLGLQLVTALQLPPAALVQRTVAAGNLPPKTVNRTVARKMRIKVIITVELLLASTNKQCDFSANGSA